MIKQNESQVADMLLISEGSFSANVKTRHLPQ